jgi:PIN domain nuclease of toxin-antitoxin system
MVMGLARPGGRSCFPAAEWTVTLLLDTHFLIWLVLGSKRISRFPWLDQYRPWGVSPVSLLEIQFLAEIGRLTVRNPDFTNAVMKDARFTVDDIPLTTLVRSAIRLDWTRDPFDRLLVAHSAARRVAFCTTDRGIRDHHRLVPTELEQT